MKKKIIFITYFIFIIFNSFSQKSSSRLVVILDSGHGGSDWGGKEYLFKNKARITESAYCYDLTLRLEKLLKKEGIIVFKTTFSDKTEINNNKLNEIIHPCNNAIFVIDKTKVNNSRIGLSKRTTYASLIRNEHYNLDVIFIAIHFDITYRDLIGVRIIKDKTSDKLALCLYQEFKKENLLINSKSFVKSGDIKNGIKNLYVLDNKNNKVIEKVLLELGNLKNSKDLKRIQDYRTREKYADIIFKAIKNYRDK